MIKLRTFLLAIWFINPLAHSGITFISKICDNPKDEYFRVWHACVLCIVYYYTQSIFLSGEKFQG